MKISLRFGALMRASFLVALLLSTFNSQLSTARAQGSLTPPGAPAPTMKTLDQVEPRKEINATNTPGDASNLFIISQPGSYYLSGNITGVSGKNGIIISSGVTLDLNGFILTGGAGSLAGIVSSGSAHEITIRNGIIRSWGGRGIDFEVARGLSFENLNVALNGDGFYVGIGSIVRDCVSRDNGGSGFNGTVGSGDVGAGAIYENCFAISNTGNGFDLSVNGGVMTNCGAHFNALSGIDGGTATINNCFASENLGDGIHVGAGSTLTNCTAMDNEGTYGIFADDGSTLTNCTAFSNDVEHGIHADDRSTLTNCTASQNNSTASDSWGISVGPQSSVSNCTSNSNTNNNTTANAGGGILAGDGSTVQNCNVTGNKGDGIQVAGDCRVVGNSCDGNGNGTGAGDGAGIHSTGADNRIEGNNVTDNDRGIDVDFSGSFIIRNSASGNPGGSGAANYDIAANNACFVVVTALTAAPFTGASGGTPIGSTDPWVNFSY